MGQQQLLLVILVTIIVGIATVVAINIFGTAADQANRDAVRQDLMTAAAHAQAIWSRPAMMDGAARDFTSMDVESIAERIGIPGRIHNTMDGDNVSVEGNRIENENGVYIIAPEEAALVITATPGSGEPNIIMRVEHDGTEWTIGINDAQQ